MKVTIRRWLAAAYRRLTPKLDPQLLKDENRALTAALAERQAREYAQRDEAHRFLAEMVEAQAMCGAGPWAPGNVDAYCQASKPLREALALREAGPVGDVSPLGAYGMYELLLQNVNWQREINYSWLEFTRWGIQQIILICRLYYIKNPIVRRLVDVCSQYVFARGVDVSTEDEAANEVIKSFIKRNQKVFGHVALMELEKSKDRDGNLFFALFADKSSGECDIRVIDATEIQDIWCDPEDADVPWYYQRIWTQRVHDPANAAQETRTRQAWYPALNFDPAGRPESINGYPVMWDTPVYHRKVGAVGKWLFGCPRIYPMLDWAKEARRFLEACASVRQSLSQFAFTLTTKGGQQAVEGAKQQWETQVGPGAPIWDTNPPAGAGSAFISGTGTKLEAFKAQGSTFSPEDVRQYKLMCCMVKGVPETFLADVSTGNLATATSLDRPTETVMLSLQEEWVEDLVVLLTYVLGKSARAPGGKLREAHGGSVEIREAAYVRLPNGRRKYLEAKDQAPQSNVIEIIVDFPAIREGDIPALIHATVESMTLENKGGQIVGIDEKEGVRALGKLVPGVEDPDEMAERMYPTAGKNKYNPVRAEQILPQPVPKVQDQPGPVPTPQQVGKEPTGKAATEAMRAGATRLLGALELLEAESNGNHADARE